MAVTLSDALTHEESKHRVGRTVLCGCVMRENSVRARTFYEPVTNRMELCALDESRLECKISARQLDQ
jgi:hypothetical protein